MTELFTKHSLPPRHLPVDATHPEVEAFAGNGPCNLTTVSQSPIVSSLTSKL